MDGNGRGWDDRVCTCVQWERYENGMEWDDRVCMYGNMCSHSEGEATLNGRPNSDNIGLA